ncbi:RES domain-containing protein [Mycobacteroides abscessus subsp. abscessus]|uniref:hypothetical protein n=1 Tax=Mycobacteroides abscessus TaxID=36809 RepID=UPI000926F078|nr:hypothetical protein [Mycobacteroides abscessus]SIK10951.1 RES domain-containing protein [Mycobacteroides abscessus subsp. abscessus]
MRGLEFDGPIWWRVHCTGGPNILAWNAFHENAPLLSPGVHSSAGVDTNRSEVCWAAADPTTALAEAFRANHTIDRYRRQPYLTGLRFTRNLHLAHVALDSHAAQTGYLDDESPSPDGLRYVSPLTGSTCIALFPSAADAIPSRPVISQPLTHPGLALRIAAVSQQLGYLVI